MIDGVGSGVGAIVGIGREIRGVTVVAVGDTTGDMAVALGDTVLAVGDTEVPSRLAPGDMAVALGVTSAIMAVASSLCDKNLPPIPETEK